MFAYMYVHIYIYIYIYIHRNVYIYIYIYICIDDVLGRHDDVGVCHRNVLRLDVEVLGVHLQYSIVLYSIA